MKFLKKNKPMLVQFQPDMTCDGIYILPSDILYICKTRVLDRVIIEKKGKKYDEVFATSTELQHGFAYFMVTRSLKFGIVYPYVLQPWLAMENCLTFPGSEIFATVPPKNASAKDIFYKYIKYVSEN